MILIVPLFLLLLTIIAWELSALHFYGWPVKDKFWLQLIENQRDTNLNVYHDILDVGFLPRIRMIPGSIFCVYYIEQVGVVPRWYKSHKLIKTLFTKAYKST